MIQTRDSHSTVGFNTVLDGEYTLFGLLGAILVVYLLYPFVTFFAGASESGLSAAAFTRSELLSAARYSLTTAPISTAIAAVLGVPLAYVLSRAEFRGKLLVDSLVILPLVLPPVSIEACVKPLPIIRSAYSLAASSVSVTGT